MTQDELASLSFAELRDRLKARVEQVGNADDIDLVGSAALSHVAAGRSAYGGQRAMP